MDERGGGKIIHFGVGGKGTVCDSEVSRGVWGHAPQKILNLDPLRSLLVHFQTIYDFQMT